MYHTPYTTQVLEAVMAAQLGIGCMIFALLWYYGIGVRSFARSADAVDPRKMVWQAKTAFVLLTVALGIVMTAPMQAEIAHTVGATISVSTLYRSLGLAATCATLAAVASGRGTVLTGAIIVDILLYRFPVWFPASDAELIAIGLVAIAALVTALRPSPTPRTARSVELLPPSYEIPETRNVRQDVALFVAATVSGAFVCTFVMLRRGGSADEWAYTWQSAVFANLRAFGTAPPCGDSLQSMFVFTNVGRAFSQYTPGWPLLMAPFFALRVVWLASPFCAGALAVAIARLSRRGAASLLDHEDPRVVTWAGWIGGLSLSFGTTYLLNVGSRYAHIATMALFAWSVEALLWLIEHPLVAKHRARWGFALGSCVALCGACRPSDGATLELSVGAIFVWALVRKRIGLRAFLATTAGVALFGGLTLVILRLQLGTWFTTGYSLNAIIHPWNVVNYSMPRGDEWKYSIPLATGEYCWFPCTLGTGIAGLMVLRRRGRLITLSMLGMIPLFLYYSFVDMGSRGRDWGYGPRYALALMVPMAIGTAIAFAPLAAAATRRKFDAHDASLDAVHASMARIAGPWALAASAMLIGFVRLVPLLWPGIHDFLASHSVVELGVERQNIHNAIVFVGADSAPWDVMDETNNLPLDFYKQPDVIYAIDRTPELTQCLKDRFKGRKYLRARNGFTSITFEPF